jgi:excisionase family DNA binding protein
MMEQTRSIPQLSEPAPLAVSVRTAANMLEISVATVNRLVKSGKLTKCQIAPNTTRIPIASLSEFLEETQRETLIP